MEDSSADIEARGLKPVAVVVILDRRREEFPRELEELLRVVREDATIEHIESSRQIGALPKLSLMVVQEHAKTFDKDGF